MRNGGGASNGSANSVANGSLPYVNGNGSLTERLRMERKQSSPMAPAFMVSAPGKVIVFGEHAVVHGKVRYAPRSLYSSSVANRELHL